MCVHRQLGASTSKLIRSESEGNYFILSLEAVDTFADELCLIGLTRSQSQGKEFLCVHAKD